MRQKGLVSNELRIRELEDGDFNQWLGLWSGYNAFYGRSGTTAVPAEITDLTWCRLHDLDQPMFALVATISGELVALAHYLFHLSSTSAAPACYLRDLFTSPISRGQGVATALINHVCGKAREAGSTSIYWQTHKNNRVARKMYDNVASLSEFVIYQKLVSLPGDENRD